MATFEYKGDRYPFADPDSWTTLEAIKISAYANLKPAEIMTDLAEYQPLGLHCAVWVSLRRAGVDVALDELELPFISTMNSFEGEPGTEPPDPSTASTAKPKAARRTQSGPARSPRKS